MLPGDLTGDLRARQRFEREARAAAALAHPHICALLDIGRDADVDYLVMAYLDGETLATRLTRGPLPLDEALTCARQIADALAAAHHAGIVHRDLKPANVMLTSAGAVLLDFGLAKWHALADSHDATGPPDPLTRAGTILGTVQYMAPEQLDGHEVDERSDVFAFGVLLYEMLAGRRPFEGRTNAALIGQILHASPAPPSTLNPKIPSGLDGVVGRCLAKDPEKRWPSFADLRTQLVSDRAGDYAWAKPGRLPNALPGPHGLLRPSVIAVGALVAAAAAGVVWWERARPAARDAPHEAAPMQGDLTRLTFDAGLQTDPAISSDGRFVAYASDKSGNFDIWTQPLAGGAALLLTRSPAADTQPSWSPDGRTIVFRSERDHGGLYVVSVSGGPERLLVDHGASPSWSADGSEIRFLNSSTDRRLFAVPFTGSATPREILPDFTEAGGWRWIAVAPDGRFSFLGTHKTQGFGFYTVSLRGEVTGASLVALRGPLSDMLHSGGQRFVWNRKGTALFLETAAYNGVRNLWRVRGDPSTLDWASAERLTTGAGADAVCAESPDGALVFSTERTAERLWLFAFDRASRRISGGNPVTEEDAEARGSDISKDGRFLLYNPLRPGSDAIDLRLRDLTTGHVEEISSNATFAAWSPDQRQMAYARIRPETRDPKTDLMLTALVVKATGGTERLVSPWLWTGFVLKTEINDWTPDGQSLLVSDGSHLTTWPVSDPPATGPSHTVLVRPNANRLQGRFSLDGRWLAFVTMRAGEGGSSRLAVTSADGAPERPAIPVAADHT